jgi:hypothetical protein
VARVLAARGVTARCRGGTATRALIAAGRQRRGRVIRQARITAWIRGAGHRHGGRPPAGDPRAMRRRFSGTVPIPPFLFRRRTG